MRIKSKRRQSRMAIWSRRAGLSGIFVLVIALVGHRANFFDAEFTLAFLAVGLTLAFCAILAALIGFVAVWREGRSGFSAAVIGLLIGVALLAYPAYLFGRLIELPGIADVSTAPDPPIPFVAIDWQHPPPTANEIAAQQRAYPAIVPRVYAADPGRVFEEVLLAVATLGWEVVGQTAPETIVPPPAEEAGEAAVPVAPAGDAPIAEDAGAAAEPADAAGIVPDAGAAAPPPVPVGVPEPLAMVAPGFVEAIARTLVIGFREDVVIRVAADPAGTVVDVRSASRLFQHDFGSNAQRIERFFDELDGRLRAAAGG